MRVLLPLNHRRKKRLTAAELLALENESSTDPSAWTKRDAEEDLYYYEEDDGDEEEEDESPAGIGKLPIEAFAEAPLPPPEGLEEKKPAAQVFVGKKQEATAEFPRKRAPTTLDIASNAPTEALFSIDSSSTSTPGGTNPTVKRPRTTEHLRGGDTARDDTKPPAKPPATTKMVAPKRAPSPSLDGHGERRSSWEENEPTRYNNNNQQNYYRNHPGNHHNRQLSPTTTSSNYRPIAAAAARPKSYNDDPAIADGSTTEEEEFAAALRSIGLEIVPQAGDGNCLFRAVSLQVYGDASMHAQVREQCLNFMAVNEEHFGQFLTDEESFEGYIARKRQIGVHGNNPEIQAVSELFNRPVQIYAPHSGAKPLNIFHKEYKTADEPIRLSYHDNNHYNAIVDPRTPTAGLGLGLPGLQPGLADKLQVAAATAESDLQNDLDQAIAESQKDHSKYNEDQLQKALKESSYTMEGAHKDKALALSDVDATNFELEQAVILETWEDQGRKQRARRRTSPQTTPAPAPLVSHSHGPAVAAAAAAPSSPSPEHSSSVAAAAAPAAPSPQPPTESSSLSPYDYPDSVQELVMNGFPLKRVVQAYELVGDKFDDMLAFLMMQNS